MKEAIPRRLPDFEDEHGALAGDLRERLLAISHSTIDRILKGAGSKRGEGRHTPRGS